MNTFKFLPVTCNKSQSACQGCVWKLCVFVRKSDWVSGLDREICKFDQKTCKEIRLAALKRINRLDRLLFGCYNNRCAGLWWRGQELRRCPHWWRSPPCSKSGDGEDAAMWPPRTFVRLYRLRLVTFEPAKLRKAIPISESAGEGTAEARRGAATGYKCLISCQIESSWARAERPPLFIYYSVKELYHT